MTSAIRDLQIGPTVASIPDALTNVLFAPAGRNFLSKHRASVPDQTPGPKCSAKPLCFIMVDRIPYHRRVIAQQDDTLLQESPNVSRRFGPANWLAGDVIPDGPHYGDTASSGDGQGEENPNVE
jgi:hypothetical protein